METYAGRCTGTVPVPVLKLKQLFETFFNQNLLSAKS
jgi:hypothetical protein